MAREYLMKVKKSIGQAARVESAASLAADKPRGINQQMIGTSTDRQFRQRKRVHGS